MGPALNWAFRGSAAALFKHGAERVRHKSAALVLGMLQDHKRKLRAQEACPRSNATLGALASSSFLEEQMAARVLGQDGTPPRNPTPEGTNTTSRAIWRATKQNARLESSMISTVDRKPVHRTLDLPLAGLGWHSHGVGVRCPENLQVREARPLLT